MYTDTQQALRNSLWNFMGSILTASALEEAQAKESVMALMSEEMCKFVKNENETSIDMVAAKPILKAAIWILDSKIIELNNILDTAPEVAHSAIIKNITDVQHLSDDLTDFISRI